MRTAYFYPIQHRLAFVLAIAYVIMMNYLANAIPFGLGTSAEISDAHPTMITPAAYAFSIWGLIYLCLVVFAYYQLRRGKDVRMFRFVWPWMMLNLLANGLWLIAFQNEWFIISMGIMLFMLYTFIRIFHVFYRLRRIISTTHRFFFQVPFSIYFGWLSVASLVNLALLINHLIPEITETTQVVIAISLLAIAFLSGFVILVKFQDYSFSLVVVWALIAIWYGDGQSELVRTISKYTGFALAGVILTVFIADRIKVAQFGRQLSR